MASSQVSRASGLELQSANIGLQTASAPATRACNKGLQQGPATRAPSHLPERLAQARAQARAPTRCGNEVSNVTFELLTRDLGRYGQEGEGERERGREGEREEGPGRYG